MKYLMVLFTFLSLNFVIDQDSCTLEIEKDQLLERQIILSCEAFQKGTELIIEEFTIKFPGHPSEVLTSGVLNSKTRSYLKAANKGDIVVIFDIKKAKTQTGETIKDVPPFNITFK